PTSPAIRATAKPPPDAAPRSSAPRGCGSATSFTGGGLASSGPPPGRFAGRLARPPDPRPRSSSGGDAEKDPAAERRGQGFEDATRGELGLPQGGQPLFSPALSQSFHLSRTK